MYSVLFFTVAFILSSGFVSSDDAPPAEPSLPPAASALVQANGSAPLSPDPVKPVDAPVNAPLPVAENPPPVVIVAPENPAVFANTSNESVDNITKLEENTTLQVPPPGSDVENPEISARRQNVPGLINITSDGISSKFLLGARCVTDNDCTVQDSFCQGSACVCKDGYRASKIKLEACVQIPKALNDSCEASSECDLIVHSSECINNQCLCPGNFVADQGACWESKALGATCDTNIQCTEILNAACLQGVCACPIDYVPSPTSNKCLRLAKEGFQSDCYEDIQCTGPMGDNARCNSKKCICKDSYHYNGTTCSEDRKLGSPCEKKEDCIVSLSTEPSDQRTCLDNNCTCATGYKLLKGEDHCVKAAADQIALSLSWMICVVIAKYFI